MIKFLLLLVLPFLLHASKILNYNVYDRTDRVDVMITFDTPFEGKIKQNTSTSHITIKLEGASIEARKAKDLSSKFLHSLRIIPLETYTKIIAEVPGEVTLKASKTSDSYGLRLRFSKVVPTTSSNPAVTPYKNSSTSALPTKKTEDISTNYYIVIGILLLGIVILFVLKNKITAPKTTKQSSSWLFNANKNTNTSMPEGVNIRFEKNINEQNSVVMLDYEAQSYLVLMGSNNILLDKFTDNKPLTQDDFETILQNRHQELDDFLQEGTSIEKDPMQTYKEKAANISYTS